MKRLLEPSRPLREILVSFAIWLVALTSVVAAGGASPLDYRPLAAMIEIETPGLQPAIGAGIVVSQRAGLTLVVTAAHLVQAPNPKIVAERTIGVVFRAQNRQSYPATVRHLSPRKTGLDLAVLAIEGDVPAVLSGPLLSLLPPPDIDAFEGHGVKLIGYMNQDRWDQSLEHENLSEVTPEVLVVASQYVSNGASGGPLISEHGALVGMVHTEEQGRARALPIARILEAFADWGVVPDWKVNESVRVSRAAKRLRDRGVLNRTGLTDALTQNDEQILADLGIASNVIGGELFAVVLQDEMAWKPGRSVASEYFAKAQAASGSDYSWIAGAVAAGLDPNQRVAHAYYDEEGLLLAAMREGNSDAMRTLLEAGASPHGYQHLFGTRYSESRFLFPLFYLMRDETFSDREDLVRFS